MRLERGVSLTEILFALMVTAFIMPFAISQITDISDNLKNMSVAREIISDSDAIRNYMRLNFESFNLDEITEVPTDDENTKLFVMKTPDSLTTFVIKKNDGDIIRSHKIVDLIGMDAAVVEEDKVAYSSMGWAVNVPDAKVGDIVFRIDAKSTLDDSEKYLNRTILSEGELSTMKRDLSMGNFGIENLDTIYAKKLSVTNLDAYEVESSVITTTSLYFVTGLNLNPEKSIIPSIRVNGDVIGFRNLYTDEFSSPNGTIMAERASINEKLKVSNKFEVKSSSSRTVSGFAGISASVLRTAFLETDNLTFLPGFGLTVSSELLYSDSPPIKLGNWTFPNSVGPRISRLELKNLSGGKIISAMPDFSKILKEGWR